MRTGISSLILSILGTVLILFVGASALSEPTIDKVTFTGNLPADESFLLRGSGLHSGVSVFTVSAGQVHNAVISNLRSLGYLDCSVNVEWPRWGSEEYEVKIDVLPGRQSLLGGIVFCCDSTFPVSEIAKRCPIEYGAPITPSDTLNFKTAILDMYARRGFIRAEVNLSLLPFADDSSGGNRVLQVSINKKDVCYLGAIAVSGNSKVRSKVVLREFDTAPGDTLDMGVIRQGLSAVYGLGLFSNVRITYGGLSEGRDTIDIVINVTEQDYITVDFAGGYVSPEAAFCSAFWRQPNIMGNNQLLELGSTFSWYTSRQNGGQEFEPRIVYEEPWFISTRWHARLKGDYYYLQRDHQEERSYGGEISFSRKFSQNWRISTAYRIERLRYRSTLEDSTEVVQDWVNTARISSGVTRDTRAPLINPTGGSWFKLAGGVSGGVAGGSLDIYLADTEYRLFLQLSHGVVLAGRVAGGVVFGYAGNTSIPPNDRLYLGGGSTVRGYDYHALGPEDADGNPIGGNVMTLGNAEVRLPVVGKLGVVFFCDLGGVWTKLEEISTMTSGFGTGMGIRYDTVVGPIRLDYGFAPTWRNSIRRGKVYFAIGQAF